MGNRAVVVFLNQDEYSAGVYIHWSGGTEGVLGALKQAEPRLRHGDQEYSAARFCGVLHEMTPGNTGIGIVNAPKNATEMTDGTWRAWGDFAGDNGVYLVDVISGDVRHIPIWDTNTRIVGRLNLPA